ncbi:MAG: hypothetical protein WA993_01040 [Candidatus Binatus sp.]|jgi:hypothetical protein|uniref:hypothetical protein n=1 Tax=Candidatus Binatus sp. TaxID=2811406 RepID=UPI003CB4778C
MNRTATSKWFIYVLAGFSVGYLWLHFDRLSAVYPGLKVAASTVLNIAWWH